MDQFNHLKKLYEDLLSMELDVRIRRNERAEERRINTIVEINERS